MKSFKINEQYMKDFSEEQKIANNDFYINTQNIFLLPYEELNVCKYFRNKNTDTKILLHHFSENEFPNISSSLFKQENRIMKFSNIRDSIIQSLYPIQQDYNNISAIITQNCEVSSLLNYEQITPFNVDIFSIDALKTPKIQNSELMINKFEHDDYKDLNEYEQMRKRIKLLINFAVGNQYNILITGTWGLNTFYNPTWGLIQLWNNTLFSYDLKKYDLNIIFCIPVLEDKIYTADIKLYYDYFKEYLICASPKEIDLNIIKKQKKRQEELLKLTQKEIQDKKIFRGMIWGSILGEVLYTGDKSNQSIIEWNTTTQFTYHIMRFLSVNKFKLEMNKLFDKLANTKNVQLNYLLNNKAYRNSPIKFMKFCEKNKKTFSCTYAMPMIHILSFYDIEKSNLLIFSLNNDIYLLLTYICVNYILNMIYSKKYIKTTDLQSLYGKCMKYLDNNEQIKQEFDIAWSNAINYKFHVNNGFEQYNLLNCDNKFQTLCVLVALLYDMYSFVIINNIKAIDFFNYIQITELDTKFNDKEIILADHVPKTYIFEKFVHISKTYDEHTTIICGLLFGLIYPLEIDNLDQGTNDSKKWKKKLNKHNILDDCMDKYIQSMFEQMRIKDTLEYIK